MRELSNINRLLLLAAALVILIIIGFVNLRKPDIQYHTDIRSALEDLRQDTLRISANEVKHMLLSAENSLVLIDLRPAYVFDKGHIAPAVNIPVHSLLEKNRLETIRSLQKKWVRIVLYGDDEAEATSPWALLQQIGISQVRILEGGYLGYTTPDSTRNKENTTLVNEESVRYDYATIMEGLKAQGDMSSDIMDQPSGLKTPEKIVPVKRKKQSVTEGGC